MNELEIISIFSQALAESFKLQNIANSQVNWPNVKSDHTKHDIYYEIDFVFYPAQQISLKKGRRVSGCVSVKSFSKLNKGIGEASENIKAVAYHLAGKDFSSHDGFINTETPELRILDNTLSLTQTTTDIPNSQMVYLVNFSFIG